MVPVRIIIFVFSSLLISGGVSKRFFKESHMVHYQNDGNEMRKKYATRFVPPSLLYQVKEKELSLYDKFAKDTSLQRVIDSLSKIGYHLENSLPNGYVKDGSVDYTFLLQQGIDRHKVIVFPPFPLLINEKGLTVPSNRKIVFLKGSKLLLKPNNDHHYDIILLNKVSDVTLFNPVIQGDRYRHLSSEGEWGMGIGIYSSDNINVYGAHISNCWGDGIYISQRIGFPPPRNVVLQNIHCHYNRRNGITIISGITIKLIDPEISFSNGTPPGAGIDIEPNSPQNEIRSLIILNPVTKYNSGSGLQIGLNQLMKKGLKEVSIQIYKPIDISSDRGLVVACWPGDFSQRISNQMDDKYGYIKIINPRWQDNRIEPMKVHSYRADQILLQITNPVIKDSINTFGSTRYLENKLQKVLRRGGNLKISGY